MTSRSPAWGAWLVVVCAWGLAFSLAAHLTSSNPEPGPASGMADWLLGESRQALSLSLFDEADLYFHKGVAHHQASRPLPGPFQRWQTNITPAQHSHASGQAIAEILPWLKLAIQADPHNVDAFLVSAFWAGTGLHRPDLAASILDEAQRMNPSDYRIPLEKGRLAISTRHFDKAMSILDTSLSLHARTPSTPDRLRELALDQAEILTFLGFLHETKGETPEAVRCFKNALAIFPERSYIKERIGFLEAGQNPPASAQSLLEQITRKTVHDACKDDETHHHDDDADHDE